MLNPEPVDRHVMDRAITLPWWRQRRLQLVAGALALVGAVLLVAALLDGERHLRMDRDQLGIATVTRGTFNDFVPLRARVVPRETIYLDAVEGGRVERVMVEPGDLVEANQPLLRLANTELELTVLDREARLIESITQLQARQSQLEQDRLMNQKQLADIEYNITRLTRSLQRRKALLSESQELRDTLQDELDYNRRLLPLQAESNTRQEQLRVQQLPQIATQLEKLHQDVEITRSKLDSLIVRAAVAGRITAMDLKVGENRNRGERLGELTPDIGFKLIATVDEFYLGRLRAGQWASAEIDSRPWPLQVTRVRPQVRAGGFEVELAFMRAPPENLVTGQAVQGKFALGAASNAIIIPAGPFLQQTGGNWVFVVSHDGETAVRRHITPGRRNVEQLEVKSGLEPGERVITSDYSDYDRVDRIDIQ
jgi:HlyD family secretion protein